jgi:hypothetical protein
VKIDSINVKEYTTKNENFYIAVSICNKSFLPLVNTYVNFIYQIYERKQTKQSESEVIVTLNPRKYQKIIFEQSFDKYVYANLTVNRIIVRDLLGLFRLRIKCSESASWSVIPDISKMENQPICDFNETVFSENLGVLAHNSDSEFDGIREYQPGDALSRIHNKLSAKSEVIYTREFKEEVIPKLELDLYFADSEKEEEKAIEHYANRGHTLVSAGKVCEMINIGYDISPTIVTELDTLQKHLINVIENIRTQKYNEYIINANCEIYEDSKS